jgi:hypothetical protein
VADSSNKSLVALNVRAQRLIAEQDKALHPNFLWWPVTSSVTAGVRSTGAGLPAGDSINVGAVVDTDTPNPTSPANTTTDPYLPVIVYEGITDLGV